MANGRYRQGKFTPRNPDKYVGDVDNIVYRSSWELHTCKFLDNNPNIIEWSSEEVVIPYVKPTDGKIHRYFMDFWVKSRGPDGNIRQELIEIKPYKQTIRSRAKKPQIRMQEDITLAINMAKWKAAKQYADAHNQTFRILTEKDIFRN